MYGIFKDCINPQTEINNPDFKICNRSDVPITVQIISEFTTFNEPAKSGNRLIAGAITHSEIIIDTLDHDLKIIERIKNFWVSLRKLLFRR